MSLVLDVELALSERVPELDGSVSGSRNDLSVVGRERDREDVGGVSDESSGGESRVEVPKSEGVVPRRRESELAVGRDHNVRDEVVVSVLEERSEERKKEAGSAKVRKGGTRRARLERAKKVMEASWAHGLTRIFLG